MVIFINIHRDAVVCMGLLVGNGARHAISRNIECWHIQWLCRCRLKHKWQLSVHSFCAALVQLGQKQNNQRCSLYIQSTKVSAIQRSTSQRKTKKSVVASWAQMIYKLIILHIKCNVRSLWIFRSAFKYTKIVLCARARVRQMQIVAPFYRR